MKSIATPLAALLLVAGSAVAAGTEPPVAVDVRGMSPYLAGRIQAEADKGVYSLRRYLERTYPIHQLRVDAVVRGSRDVRLAQAQKPQPDTQRERLAAIDVK
jgi:hypothetical protein